MIRTFLFDLGNVLLHFSHEQMCAQMGALCNKSPAEMRKLLFDGGHQLNIERGLFSEEQFHRWFVETAGGTSTLQQLRVAASDIFVLNAPMPAILAELKQRGHRLVLLSNTSYSHFEFIRERYEVLDAFDDFVLSYRVGAVKPESAIFEAALKAIDCEPGECFYTDDIEAYVKAARGYGLQAEVFTTAEELTKHLAARGIMLTGNK